MSVLVIGGTRFIGAHVVAALHGQGEDVTVLHRGTTEHAELPPVRHIRDSGAAYPIVDLPRQAAADWDLVIHMVAMGEADAKAAVDFFEGRAGRLVIVSSSDVYRAYGRLTGTEPGPPEPVPLAEDAPLRSVRYPYRGMEDQLGAFARDYEKILAENAVREARSTDWTILRLPKVYGPEDNADLATIYGFAAVPDWRWTHAHVDNVAAAIVQAARHRAARAEIFNVGEVATPTMGERLGRLPKLTGETPALPPFDFGQPLVLDCSKIRDCLGYADVVDEQDAMEDLAARAASKSDAS